MLKCAQINAQRPTMPHTRASYENREEEDEGERNVDRDEEEEDKENVDGDEEDEHEGYDSD